MKKLTLIALVAAMGAGVGCKGNQKGDVSQVPPPAPMEQEAAPTTFEPVQVQATEPVPAYTEPVPMEPAPAAPAAGGTYTVEKGDTIYSIARKVYGSNTRAKDIIAANPGIDPNKIKAGQTLTLPQ